jgi:hypothetical protein
LRHVVFNVQGKDAGVYNTEFAHESVV